jgi:hypothetical protein
VEVSVTLKTFLMLSTAVRTWVLPVIWKSNGQLELPVICSEMNITFYSALWKEPILQ